MKFFNVRAWFTQTNVLPNWAWIVIAAAVLAIIIVIIVAAVSKAKAGKKGAATDASAKAGESDTDGRGSAEKPAEADGSAGSLKTCDSVPAKSGQSDTPEQKQNPAKTSSKADDKQTAAKVEDKQSAAKAEEKQTAAKSEDAKKNKVYHVSKRKDDGKWQVKAAGGSKAVKLFKTQAEAIDYAKSVAENQDARIVIHKADGSFRTLNYNK